MSDLVRGRFFEVEVGVARELIPPVLAGSEPTDVVGARKAIHDRLLLAAPISAESGTARRILGRESAMRT